MPVTRKLVILGDCMVGKSNVAIRFARDRFDPDTQPNFGAAFFECVRAHDGTPGGAVKWEIFDTSGQDRYRGMNAMYYTTAAAAMVCFDITDMDSFHSAKSWINELQCCAAKCNAVAPRACRCPPTPRPSAPSSKR